MSEKTKEEMFNDFMEAVSCIIQFRQWKSDEHREGGISAIFGMLTMIDGVSSHGPGYHLIPMPSKEVQNEDILTGMSHDNYYPKLREWGLIKCNNL